MIMQKLAAPVRWQGMVFTEGGLGSAGAATPNMRQSAAEARWDQVCEGTRQAAKQQPSDSEMFPCSFSKHSPGVRGIFFVLFFLATFNSLFTIFLFFSLQCSFLPSSGPFQKRHLWARIYLFSLCRSKLPISQEQMLCLGSGKTERMEGEGSPQQVGSSCCGVDMTDALRWHGLGQPTSCIPRYYTSAPICLHFPLICASQNSMAAGLKAGLDSDGGFPPSDSANNASVQ